MGEVSYGVELAMQDFHLFSSLPSEWFPSLRGDKTTWKGVDSLTPSWSLILIIRNNFLTLSQNCSSPSHFCLLHLELRGQRVIPVLHHSISGIRRQESRFSEILPSQKKKKIILSSLWESMSSTCKRNTQHVQALPIVEGPALVPPRCLQAVALRTETSFQWDSGNIRLRTALGYWSSDLWGGVRRFGCGRTAEQEVSKVLSGDQRQ